MVRGRGILRWWLPAAAGLILPSVPACSRDPVPSRAPAPAVASSPAGPAGAVAPPPPPAPSDPPGSSAPPASGEGTGLAGSASCRECHAAFYAKWEGSRHGRAMQVVTPAFVAERLRPQEGPVEAGGVRYRVDLAASPPAVLAGEAGGARSYPLAHALGGKNVFYFLTPLERGRLQVLPVAYDVAAGRWFDAAGSMVRHVSEAPVDWRDPLLTFNTSCHSCHVSQLETNYDAAADSYRTTWAEPGISCETCHDAAGEHVRRYRAAAAGGPAPEDPGILRYRGLSAQRSTATCVPCHAKAAPLGTRYRPTDPFHDHFSLSTLEDPDFHPDGRDLGENYTCTSWLLSPCVQSGTLDCIRCHTSSGRYRFEGDAADRACLPCHADRVEKAADHHRHAPGTPGGRCVDCHMPRTTFARMTRTDHSMRPPMPAATLRFGSPNACNLCHADRDAAWADGVVRGWHRDDYQAETLRWGGWIEAARRREWKDLPAMLAWLAGKGRPPVVAASLARLLVAAPGPEADRALSALLGNGDPLVRTAAAESLAGRGGAAGPLLPALDDEARSVRWRAVAGLAAVDPATLPGKERARLEAVAAEYVASLESRPDRWEALYNLGNWRMERGLPGRAVEAFDRAAALRPDAVMPLVNAAVCRSRLGRTAEAERDLRRAAALRPGSAPARFNLGLLLAETGDRAGAERELRAALEADPSLDGAAYNLGALLGEGDPAAGAAWCRRALEIRPDSPKYAGSLAWFLLRSGKREEAVAVLEACLAGDPADPGPYALLGEIREKAGDRAGAARVYGRAAANPALPAKVRAAFEERRRALEGR